jgi:hypothetical protein
VGSAKRRFSGVPSISPRGARRHGRHARAQARRWPQFLAGHTGFPVAPLVIWIISPSRTPCDAYRYRAENLKGARSRPGERDGGRVMSTRTIVLAAFCLHSRIRSLDVSFEIRAAPLSQPIRGRLRPSIAAGSLKSQSAPRHPPISLPSSYSTRTATSSEASTSSTEPSPFVGSPRRSSWCSKTQAEIRSATP